MKPFGFRWPDKPIAEIRVHGVGGTPPEDMLDDPHPIQVSGDQSAGFFRRSTEPPDRNVEAYSWGGLTSRSALRPLWLLLLPFTLVNVAGWMVEIDPDKDPTKRQIHAEIHERLIRVIAALLTVNLVAWVAALTVDVVAYRCGSRSDCRADHAWLGPLEKDLFAAHPGRLLVVGLAVALAMFGLVDYLAKRVRSNYDEYQTDAQVKLLGQKDEAGARSKITDPEFWYRPSLVHDLAWQHRAAVLQTAAAALAWTLASIAAGDERDLLIWGARVFGVGAAIAALATGWLRWERNTRDQDPRKPYVAMTASLLAGCALLSMAIYAWGDEPTSADPSLTLFQRLPFFLLAAEVTLMIVITVAQFVWWGWQVARPGRTRRAGGAGVLGIAWAALLFVTGFALLLLQSPWWLLPATLVAAGILVAKGRSVFLWAAVVPAALAAWAFFGDGSWVAAGAAFVAVSVVWAIAATEATWLPNMFRWGAAAVLPLFGTLLLGGVFTGAAIRLVDFLDKDDPDLSTALALAPAYRWFAVVFAGALLLTILGGVAVWFQARRDVRRLEEDLGFPEFPPDAPQGASELTEDRLDGARKSIEKSLTLLRVARNGDLLLTCIGGLSLIGLGIGALMTTEVETGSGLRGLNVVFEAKLPLIAEWPPLETVASWLLAGLPLLLVGAFRSGARSEAARRRIGILWDLGTFWPRRFHPFAPPSYPERAVPELQQRIRQATSAGRRVALLGHSQGSILSFAALAPWSVEDLQRVTYVSYGSPLGTFYRRFFPAYFTSQMFHDVARKMKASPERNARGWRNYFRWTDPIGAPVFEEATNDPPYSGNADDHAGRDVRLYDPWWWWDLTGQPLPHPLGHSNYLDDPEMSAWTQTLWSDANEA